MAEYEMLGTGQLPVLQGHLWMWLIATVKTTIQVLSELCICMSQSGTCQGAMLKFLCYDDYMPTGIHEVVPNVISTWCADVNWSELLTSKKFHWIIILRV